MSDDYRLMDDILTMNMAVDDAIYKAHRYRQHKYDHQKRDVLNRVQEIKELCEEIEEYHNDEP